MAVLLTSFTRYLGTSADAKPTTDVSAGSEFFESDSGRRFVWTGRDWLCPATEQGTRSDALAVRLDALIEAQAKTNALLEVLIAHVGE